MTSVDPPQDLRCDIGRLICSKGGQKSQTSNQFGSTVDFIQYDGYDLLLIAKHENCWRLNVIRQNDLTAAQVMNIEKDILPRLAGHTNSTFASAVQPENYDIDSDSEDEDEDNQLVEMSDGARQNLINEISTEADLLGFTQSAESRMKDAPPTGDLIDFGDRSVALIDFGPESDLYSEACPSQLDDIIAELEAIDFGNIDRLAGADNIILPKNASVAIKGEGESVFINETWTDASHMPAKYTGKRKFSVFQSNEDDIFLKPVGNASLFTPVPVSRNVIPLEAPEDADLFVTPSRPDIGGGSRISETPHKAEPAADFSDDEGGTDFPVQRYLFLSRKKRLEEMSQFDDIFHQKKIPRLSFDDSNSDASGMGEESLTVSSTGEANMSLGGDISSAASANNDEDANVGKAPQVPSSINTLVETPTLQQLGMKYNLKYNMVYCTECKGGFMFGSFVHHAYKGAKRIMDFDVVRKVYSQPKRWAHHSRLPLLRGANVKKTSNQIEMRDEEVEALVINELRQLGYDPQPIYSKPLTDKKFRHLWQTVYSIPHSDQVSPIAGPRIHPYGFCCRVGDCATEEFPYCCLTKETMRGHFKEEHPELTGIFAKIWNPGPECQIEHNVTLQSMCAVNSSALFFKVPSGDAAVDFEPNSKVKSSLTLTEILELEQAELFGSLPSAPNALDPDLIHPSYHETGIARFWARFEPQDLAPLKEIVVTKKKSVLKEEYIIRQAIMATFLDICLHAQSAKAHVLRLIMEGCRGKKGVIFTIPKPKTLRLYVDVEILLLRWLVYVRKHPIKDKTKRPLFVLDKAQEACLESLLVSARRNDSIKTVALKVVELLHRLYFPLDIDRSAFDAFLEPVNAFFAVLSLTDDIAPRPLDHVPHYCSRLQFAMRLRGYHHLFTTYSHLYPELANAPGNKSMLTNSTERRKQVARGKIADQTSTAPSKPANKNDIDASDEEYQMSSSEDGFESGVGTMAFKQIETQQKESSWWRNTAVPFCKQYLSEDEATPFAWIRTVMHLFSAAVRHSRKRPQVKWISSERLLLDNHDITLARFKTHFLFRLNCLEEFFRDKLLFGKTLDQLKIVVDFNALGDSGDEATIGYCPLVGSINGNEDCTKFLRALLDDPASGMVNLADRDINWNQEIAEEWLFNIHKATGETHAATHISQGAAGRISEEAKMQISNTKVGRRHLFLTPGLNTLCLWSNYWKGSSKSGTFKEALRVIPYRIARLLFILNRIIRPLALRYLAKYRISSDNESRAALYTTYQSFLWASLGIPFSANQIYQSFPLFLHSLDAQGEIPFNFSFGPRLYRQFVVAVQRKHIGMSVRYSPEMMMNEASVGDEIAGRSGLTSQQSYAVEESIIKRSPGFLNHHIEYSKKWHEFLGIPTEKGEDESYLV